MPLRTRLNTGDQVDIITSKNATPSPAWERFVVTGKAKSRIRRYLRTRRRADIIAQGRELLQRAAHKEHVDVSHRQLEAVIEGFREKSVDDLLVAIGERTLGSKVVLEALGRGGRPASAPETGNGDKIIPLRRRRADPQADGREATIRGLSPGMAISFARCCHPIPGDPIIGVVRTGRSVAVHRTECRTLARSSGRSDRWLDLGWNPTADGAPRATTRLHVMSLHQPGSLGALSTAIGKEGGNITDVRFGSRSPDLYEIMLDLEVVDRDHLDRIVAHLRANPVVTSVERAHG